MKSIFVIGALLIFAIGVSSVEADNSNKEKSLDISILIVEAMNTERKQLADRVQIANMHELKWSDDLVKTVPEINCKNPESVSKQDFGYFKEMKKIEEVIKEIENHPNSKAECFNPVNTEIGCVVAKDCSLQTGPDCRCGPKKKFSKDDIKEGKPASKCDNGVKDGFCIANGSQGLKIILSLGALNLIIFYLVSHMI